MKNAIRFTSLLFILFSLQSQFAIADSIPTVTVTGIRDSGGGYSGTGSNLNDVGQSPTDQTADSDTYWQACKTKTGYQGS